MHPCLFTLQSRERSQQGNPYSNAPAARFAGLLSLLLQRFVLPLFKRQPLFYIYNTCEDLKETYFRIKWRGEKATWWRPVYNWTKKSSHGQLHIIFQKPSANSDDWEHNIVKTAKWPSQDVSNTSRLQLLDLVGTGGVFSFFFFYLTVLT